MRGSFREGALAHSPLCSRVGGLGRWGRQGGPCSCCSKTLFTSCLFSRAIQRGSMGVRGARQWCGHACTRGLRARGGSRCVCGIDNHRVDGHRRQSHGLLNELRKGGFHCIVVLGLKEALPACCRATGTRVWFARRAVMYLGTWLRLARRPLRRRLLGLRLMEDNCDALPMLAH